MKTRIFLPLLLTVLTVATATITTAQAASNGAKNKDGSVVTGVLTAVFDPTAGLDGVPIPNNLFFLGTTDLTINVDTEGLDPGTAALVTQLNSLDGFSPTERWVTSFVDDNRNPGMIDPDSVLAGQSVRVFQVTTTGIVGVTGVVRELTPGVDYIAASDGGRLAIIPLQPLAEYSSFMAVLTNDIKDMAGNDATPDQTYFLTKRREPWVDESGRSTYPLLDDATAQALALLQPVTASMEAAAASQGINPDDIILAWTVQTTAVSPTLRLLSAITEPAPVQALPSGLNTSAVGGFGLADISIGIITLPYFHGIPSEENPAAPLTEFWRAEPGAYIPPFDQFGLDPTSTNITVANPFPVPTGMVTVPILISVPNANSGMSKPESGWPVAIYAHGITRNRTDMLALADSMAAAGYAVIAMDHPMHGVVPEVEPNLAPFKIDNHPVFGDLATERTFDVDFFNNETNLPGPDGLPDRSGQSYFNIGNLRAARDNLRQSVADLFVLAASLENISVDGDTTPDLNAMDVGFISHSYGVFIGVPFLAMQPNDIVSRAYINSGGALLLRTGEAGAFGDLIRALLSGAGIEPGTPEFELFLTVGQTMVASTDPASYAAEVAMKMPVLNNTVIGDLTVPNTVAGQPMGGNEGLTRLLGLESFDSSQMNPEGLRSVARFVPPAFHESLFRTVDDDDPDVSAPAATFEMQGQMASFIASGGTFVNVGNPDTLLPVMTPFEVEIAGAQDDLGDDLGVKSPGGQPVVGPMGPANSLD